jgi:hypothetical protein
MGNILPHPSPGWPLEAPRLEVLQTSSGRRWRLGRILRSGARGRASGRQGSVDDGLSNVDEEQIVVAGVVAQPREGGVHVEVSAFGEHALGLLDHDAAVQGVVELIEHDVVLDGGAVLEDGDTILFIVLIFLLFRAMSGRRA